MGIFPEKKQRFKKCMGNDEIIEMFYLYTHYFV